jgi:L-alanine-DL-glutamate epimerase-like enolase superfamily enzyme
MKKQEKKKVKGPYTKVRELIAPRVHDSNAKLIASVKKAYPRVSIDLVRRWTRRAAWELRLKAAKASKHSKKGSKS